MFTVMLLCIINTSAEGASTRCSIVQNLDIIGGIKKGEEVRPGTKYIFSLFKVVFCSRKSHLFKVLQHLPLYNV